MLWIWLISLETSLMVGDLLGWVVFSVLRIRRRTVMENLSLAFPEKSERELMSIAKKAYQNFAKMLFEYIRFPVMDSRTVFSRCQLEGEEHLEWAMKHGKGGILISGHFGNWELIGGILNQLGYPISLLVGRQRNRSVDKIMNHYRESMGTKIIPMGIAVRGAIKALRNNEFVAFLSDQNAGRKGVFINFFNKKASTPQGAAVFALKTRSPIIFFTTIRLSKGRHKIVFHKLTFDNLKGCTPENIQIATQAYTNVLENSIRVNPDHYFWMHHRWKTRPPEERKRKVNSK
jgi:KDO2-lipid IV(A) lauroyltransferase